MAVVVLFTTYNFKREQFFLKERIAKENKQKEIERPNPYAYKVLSKHPQENTAVAKNVAVVILPVILPKKEPRKDTALINREKKVLSSEFNFYTFLKKNIDTKVEFIVNDNIRNVRQVLSLSGEDLFRNVKTDFAGNLNDEIAQRVFRDYMKNYYQKNKTFDILSIERNKIDLFDLKNFARFSSLKAGFEFYQSAEKEIE